MGFIASAREGARKGGAISSKVLGAGGGGYLLLFCELDKKRTARDRLSTWAGSGPTFL